MNVAYLHLKRTIEKNSECFLCEIENEFEQKYLDNYLQELVMDTKARDEIIDSRGFCNDHSYKLLIEASKPAISDGHGVALIMQSVIEQLILDLANNRKQKKDFLEALRDKKCPACTYLNNSMGMYLREATDLLNSSDDFFELIRQSKGFCVYHHSLLGSKVNLTDTKKQGRTYQLLNQVETSNLQRINQELAEYIRRQSYEFSESDRIAVASVLLRSIEKITGRKGMKKFVEENGEINGTAKGGKAFC